MSGAPTGGTNDGGAGDDSGGSGAGGEGGGDCGSPTDPRNCGTCGHDCTKLLNVAPDGIHCFEGQCYYGPGACLPGFGHCNNDPDSGCTTDVTRVGNCGDCGLGCPYPNRYCASPASGQIGCVATCPSGTMLCGQQCVDLASNAGHCGACNRGCGFNGTYGRCENSVCVVAGCQPGHLDCQPGENGCETYQGTFGDCSACGDTCGAMHATGVCENNRCVRQCARGFGNCETGNPDCETRLDTATHCGECGRACPTNSPFCQSVSGTQACVAVCEAPAGTLCGTSCVSLTTDPQHCGGCDIRCEPYQACEAGRCTPRYLGSEIYAGEAIVFSHVDALPNGSYAVVGFLDGSADLDPGSGTDVRTSAGGWDTVIGKFDANGTRLWTHLIGGADYEFHRGLAHALDGSVVVGVDFSGTVDFDPGAGVAQRTATASQIPALVKYAANGAFTWVRTFPATGTDAQSEGYAVRADPTGVYQTGSFTGQIDLDPGTGTSVKTASERANYFVKLDTAGNFVWSVAYANACANPVELVPHTDGALWVAGTFSGSCDLDPGPGTTEANGLGQEGFVLRLDAATGATLGAPFALRDATALNAIVFDSDGSYYFGGSSGDHSTGLLFQTTSSGSSGWSRSIPYLSWFSLGPARGGGVLVAGGGTRSPGPRSDGILFEKLDRSGNQAWLIDLLGSGSNAQSIDSSDQGFVAVGQIYFDPLDIDPGPDTTLVTAPGTFITRYAY